MEPKIAVAQRFVGIDSIRGIAALSVACYHFYNQLGESFSAPLWGSSLHQLLTHGDLGVIVFFVLSGFVIACSLHGSRIDALLVGKFALRRSLRLDPTYWSIIFLTLLSILALKWLNQAPGLEIPSVADVAANMFYLDNLLGFKTIVKVGWTLCLEIQFYLVFVLLGWPASAVGGARPNAWIRGLVFLPLATYSLLVYTGIVPLDQPGLFVPYWFMYFLGVVVWWTLSAEVPTAWFVCGAMLCAAVAIRLSSVEAWVALATAVGMFSAGRLNRLDTMFTNTVLQYLGRISYSFFLVHPLVGTNFLRTCQKLLTRSERSLTSFDALLLFVCAIAVSILAAHVLYKLVESPSHRLSRRIRWSNRPPLAVARVQASAAPPRPRPVSTETVTAEIGSPDSTATAGPRARLSATARQWMAFCVREKRWVLWMSLLALVWTTELFIVQAVTLVYPNETGAKFAFWAPKIRFAMDLLFIGTLVVTLRRRWLVGLVIGSFFAYLGLLTYCQYFQRPISLLTILGNWREGLQVGGFALDLLPRRAALLLALALAVKLGFLILSRKSVLPRRGAWLGGMVLGTSYAGLFLAAAFFDPLSAIQTTRGVGRLGEIRGYLGAWFAEWYYLRDDQVLARALERRSLPYDRLTPLEADIPIRKHLVILQAESFDYNILGYRVDGQEVTPFLNRLRDAAMFYRVRAMHALGSSDADFVVLNGVAGSTHQNTYKIAGYPYQDTTPQLLARCGYRSYSFHGNSGEFYDRRGPFEKMGFAGIFFQEELENQFGLKSEHWGISDQAVFALSSQMLRTATTPTCHFIITLTTHIPYKQLPPQKDDPFPNPRTNVERYINNMRYLDNCIRDYIVSLGQDATVMIYADHPTEEGDGSFEPDRSGAREFIPCYIYDTDLDLSKLQKTRDMAVAKDGSLNLVDVINYLRAQVKRTCVPVQANAAP